MLSTPKSPGSGEKTDEQTDTQTTVRCGKGYKRCRVQTGRGVDGLRGLCTRGQDGSQAEQTRRETGFRAERTAAPAVVAHAGPCGGVSSIPTGLQGLKRLCWDGLLYGARNCLPRASATPPVPVTPFRPPPLVRTTAVVQGGLPGGSGRRMVPRHAIVLEVGFNQNGPAFYKAHILFVVECSFLRGYLDKIQPY